MRLRARGRSILVSGVGDGLTPGYSIEKHCRQLPKAKHRKNQGVILAKFTQFFDDDHNAFFGLLDDAMESVPLADEGGKKVRFNLVSTAVNNPFQPGGERPPDGITSLGKLPQDKWNEVVAESKVMLGIGWPKWSPSRGLISCRLTPAYDALCQGVPFINP